MVSKLNHIFHGITKHNALIHRLVLDSRQCKDGDLFIAMPGDKSDGRNYIPEAISRGVTAIAYEANSNTTKLPDTLIPLIPIENLSKKLSAIAGEFYGNPSHALNLVGITGTNGKTSVTHLISQALTILGEKCGTLGTLGSSSYDGLSEKHDNYTTPDAIRTQEVLFNLKNLGNSSVIMEVSSHGLKQERVSALEFNIAVLTNLTRDHLDYHLTMKEYARVKRKLFSWENLQYRILNLDDSLGLQLALEKKIPQLITYSITNTVASLYCSDVSFHSGGIRANLVYSNQEYNLETNLIGGFNLSNLLSVISVLIAMGYGMNRILEVIPKLESPPGRMQFLGNGSQPLVVVDYAHTPIALQKVCLTLKKQAKGRILCLFGCGGDRDSGKRPLMAEIAELLSDVIFITNDNPRSESPRKIFQEIYSGFSNPKEVYFIPQRAKAISIIIQMANTDDIVLLAGMGHEKYSVSKASDVRSSDLMEAKKALLYWK